MELKPCPFCGSYPILRNDASEWKVECIGEGCECLPSTWWYNTKDDAVEAWNRRANDVSEVTKRDWIPVTERLPDDTTQVLVCSGIFAPFIEIAFYDGLWYSALDGETEIEAVTHWMPLPSAPTED